MNQLKEGMRDSRVRSGELGVLQMFLELLSLVVVRKSLKPNPARGINVTIPRTRRKEYVMAEMADLRAQRKRIVEMRGGVNGDLLEEEKRQERWEEEFQEQKWREERKARAREHSNAANQRRAETVKVYEKVYEERKEGINSKRQISENHVKSESNQTHVFHDELWASCTKKNKVS